MQRAKHLGHPADWLVRAAHNRCVPDHGKLFDVTTREAPMGEISFTMASRHGVKERVVRQQLWARRVELGAGKGGAVTVTCIVAREVGAPARTKAVEWRLLTNRHAGSLDEVNELIDWYRARWEIEMLFDILKNACRVEALQLSGVDRLERALAMFMVVGWRVAYLMRLGRTSQDLDAGRYFDWAEIKAAYVLAKKPQPARPDLNEVIRLLHSEPASWQGKAMVNQV
ncbi:hypothetical protein JOD97_000004 [Duganella sp. 1411]|nr:hypothetical protein [Duganella sp. 1411]